MAGMQAMAARELLRLVVEQGSVLDPFCGSGTVLIDFRLASNLNCTCCMCSHAAEEACIAGRSAIGCATKLQK